MQRRHVVNRLLPSDYAVKQQKNHLFWEWNLTAHTTYINLLDFNSLLYIYFSEENRSEIKIVVFYLPEKKWELLILGGTVFRITWCFFVLQKWKVWIILLIQAFFWCILYCLPYLRWDVHRFVHWTDAGINYRYWASFFSPDNIMMCMF
jgi:hypothetical protein